MSAIMTSMQGEEGVGLKSVTYLRCHMISDDTILTDRDKNSHFAHRSYPYAWKPKTLNLDTRPVTASQRAGAAFRARPSAPARPSSQPKKIPAKSSPQRAVSAAAYRTKERSGSNMSSADHVLNVMGDHGSCTSTAAAATSPPKPPSLNARPPYFVQDVHATEPRRPDTSDIIVNPPRVGLGLRGAAMSGAHRPRPMSATGQPRPSTAERQRSALARRQVFEIKSIDGQLPVRYGVWEFMDPNLTEIEAHVRNIVQVQLPRTASLSVSSINRDQRFNLRPFSAAAQRPARSPLMRASSPNAHPGDRHCFTPVHATLAPAHSPLHPESPQGRDSLCRPNSPQRPPIAGFGSQSYTGGRWAGSRGGAGLARPESAPPGVYIPGGERARYNIQQHDMYGCVHIYIYIYIYIYMYV
jgi:hypothetical protein